MNREFEVFETKENVLRDHEKEAQKVRDFLREKKVFFINLMASPGAGKTTTLLRTIEALQKEYRIGIMEADVDGDVDAKAIAKTGTKVIQLHTGGSCHMDANMTYRGLCQMGVDDLDLVILENIGNLVCPAEFDVGANQKVMILSVPEGDDKPLKYPLMFTVSDCLLINKMDVKEIFDFDLKRLEENVNHLHPNMPIYPLSSHTGEGFEQWITWLKNTIESWKKHESD